MTRSRYSLTEALNRILRSLEGKALTPDNEAIPGEILNETEAVSDISELLDSSLPNESLSFSIPSTVSLANFTASAAETRLGTNTTKFVTPYTLDEFNLWGEIYTYTGTATLEAMPQDVYTQITGSFQNYVLQDNGYITTEPLKDRIMVNAVGCYFLNWQISFLGSSDVTYVIAPHMNSGTVYEGVATFKPSASGSVVSIGACAIINVTATNTQIDLRIAPGQETWFRFIAGQLIVRRLTHKQ